MSRKLLALMISGMFAGGIATSALADDKSEIKGSANTPAGSVSKSATSTSHPSGTSAPGSVYGNTGSTGSTTGASGTSHTTGTTVGTGGSARGSAGTAGTSGTDSSAATGMDSTGIGTNPNAMGGMNTAGMAGMGQHSMQATVTSVDQAKGKVNVRTSDGSLALKFPPEQLRDLKRGDTVTVHLGISK